MTRHILTAFSTAALLGCSPPAPDAPPAPAGGANISLGAIETTSAGACFAQGAAETETVLEDVVVEVVPAIKDQNGVVTSPAVFRNVTRPKAVITKEGTRFETVCPPQLTQAFVATLQRALQTRGAYRGAINGEYDTATGLAVQRFQRDAGFDSPFLAVNTARRLGVLAIARDAL
jgi:hypothetical protein